MRVSVVTHSPLSYSETFIRQHVTNLPAETLLMEDWPPWSKSGPRWRMTLPGRAYSRALSFIHPKKYRQRITASYVELFRRNRIDVVLAEFGPTGVFVMDACRELVLPLVVHFHGYDMSERRVLAQYGADYAVMFRQAAAIVAVSRLMQKRLIEMGAPPERVQCVPCGVDCELFGGATPAESPPLVVAVGRFVEKKGPHLTLAAFAKVLRDYPEARLRMIGDGPMLEECRTLAVSLGIGHAVTFLGSQPHHVVAEQMRGARVFAQHSIEAASGAVEGTPVAILEAGASGLPVVSTYHGGIPDVVIPEETGLLLKEGDVAEMARQMYRLLSDSALAGTMGKAARQRIETHYSATRSLDALWAILRNATSPDSP